MSQTQRLLASLVVAALAIQVLLAGCVGPPQQGQTMSVLPEPDAEADVTLTPDVVEKENKVLFRLLETAQGEGFASTSDLDEINSVWAYLDLRTGRQERTVWVSYEATVYEVGVDVT